MKSAANRPPGRLSDDAEDRPESSAEQTAVLPSLPPDEEPEDVATQTRAGVAAHAFGSPRVTEAEGAAGGIGDANSADPDASIPAPSAVADVEETPPAGIAPSAVTASTEETAGTGPAADSGEADVDLFEHSDGPGEESSFDAFTPAVRKTGRAEETSEENGDDARPGATGDTSGDEAVDDVPPEDDSLSAPERRTRVEPLPESVVRALTGALNELKKSVSDLRFGLDIPGAKDAERVRREILAQIDDYAIPRVRMSTAPALIVVAGSTGAGKSTIVNTLAGSKVSATGVRRPTTSIPVLVCHPDEREWFMQDGLLGGLRRVAADGAVTSPDSLIVAASDRLPEGVALLDSPDIDSVVEDHHEMAHRMLDAADLWIFVTTAARYADAPAWRLLRLAKERGSRLAIVLSRVAPRSRDVVVKHFVRMLTDYGLGDVQRFVIDECTTRDGRLPEEQIRELRLWLTELSVDEDRRERAIRDTLAMMLEGFRVRVPALARHLEKQVALRAQLRSDVDAAYSEALAEIDEVTRNGSLLRGEVLARWQDFAGSGDILRALHWRKPTWFGGKGSRRAPERQRALRGALRTALESVVLTAARRAAEDVVQRWNRRGKPGESLAATPGLGQISDETVQRAGRTIAAWQDHMVELVRKEGVTKRSVAKVMSFDEESLALIFMVGLLGYGMTQAAGGDRPAMPQRLLRALLGAESLRSISVKARNDLRARIGMLFDEETMRYVQVLDGAGVPDESVAARLYQATYNLEVAG